MVPSTIPPFNSKAGAVFAKLAKTLAGAVASDVEIAIADGPFK